ncbi:MAG: hypothetical protein ACR2P7_01595 [bacterium]
MIAAQRKAHRIIWLLLAPLLVVALLYLGRPGADLSPPNAQIPAASTAPGKGALP